MPRGDRTGPMGAGPMTGRRAGYCAGYSAPGFNTATAPLRGSGFRFGGGGRGWRNMFYATSMPGWQRFSYPPIVPQEGAESLKAQAEWLKNLLDAVEKRINDLEEK